MRHEKKVIDRLWFKAKLTPLAQCIFTPAFYPAPNRLGNRYVFFTQVDVTSTAQKVLVASKLTENGLRMMTRGLAEKCLLPRGKATKAEMDTLNEISKGLKV